MVGRKNNYSIWVQQHLQAVEQSGYHGMSKKEQQVIQQMAIQTYHSFLECVELVQKHLSVGRTLGQIKQKYRLKNLNGV